MLERTEPATASTITFEILLLDLELLLSDITEQVAVDHGGTSLSLTLQDWVHASTYKRTGFVCRVSGFLQQNIRVATETHAMLFAVQREPIDPFTLVR